MLRWLVRSMPLRPIAVMLLPDAGDPGFSYCARLNTVVRVEHSRQAGTLSCSRSSCCPAHLIGQAAAPDVPAVHVRELVHRAAAALSEPVFGDNFCHGAAQGA